MREILFRGKTKGNVSTKDGVFVYGLPFYNEKRIIDGIESKDGKLYYVLPETVGQFTGLTDKNGKKIFEGDILDYGDTKNEVVFERKNGSAYFGVKMSEVETWEFGNYVEANKLEVIGNIHDNPELLKDYHYTDNVGKMSKTR